MNSRGLVYLKFPVLEVCSSATCLKTHFLTEQFGSRIQNSYFIITCCTPPVLYTGEMALNKTNVVSAPQSLSDMQFQDDIIISTIEELQDAVRLQRRGTYPRMNLLLFHIYEDDID